MELPGLVGFEGFNRAIRSEYEGVGFRLGVQGKDGNGRRHGRSQKRPSREEPHQLLLCGISSWVLVFAAMGGRLSARRPGACDDGYSSPWIIYSDKGDKDVDINWIFALVLPKLIKWRQLNELFLPLPLAFYVQRFSWSESGKNCWFRSHFSLSLFFLLFLLKLMIFGMAASLMFVGSHAAFGQREESILPIKNWPAHPEISAISLTKCIKWLRNVPQCSRSWVVHEKRNAGFRAICSLFSLSLSLFLFLFMNDKWISSLIIYDTCNHFICTAVRRSFREIFLLLIRRLHIYGGGGWR